MAERTRDRVPTDEAMRIAGFVNRATFLKAIRARRIEHTRGRGHLKLYARAQMEELAREREAAETRRARAKGYKGDPLTDPPTTGDTEAQVFALFDEQVGLTEVVKRLKLPAAVVDHLFEIWWRMKQRTQAWLRPQPAPEPPPLPPTPSPPGADVEPVSLVPPMTPRQASETGDVLTKARVAMHVARKVAGA